MTIMTTFSVKNENTIPNMYNQSKNLTVHSNEKDREDKIIVYNIEKDFLIPMLISPIQNNSDILTAVFYEKKHYSLYGDSITLEKNDIYFEYIDSFSIQNELTKISKINDLSALYNIKGNIEDKYNGYCTLGKILILFYCSEDKQGQIKRNYKLIDWIKKSKERNCILCYYNKNVMPNSNKNKEISLVVNTFFLYTSNYNSLNFIYSDIISFIDLLIDIRCVISFSLNGITFLPLFPSTVNNTNFLYKKSIFFINDSSIIDKATINQDILRKLLLGINSSDELYLSNQKNKEMIEILYHFCIEIFHNDRLFNDVIHLFVLSYHNYLKKNYFYSNITILLLYQYIFHFLFKDNNNNKTKHLIYISNLSDGEDDSLLTESFRQQISTIEGSDASYKFINYYFNETMTYYLNNISPTQKEINVYTEEQTFLKSINLNYSIKKSNNVSSQIINSFMTIYLDNLEIYSSVKISNNNTRQVWFFNHLSPIDKFIDSFISDQNMIPNFFWSTHIIPYITFYKKYPLEEDCSIELYDKRYHIEKLQATYKGIKIREAFKDLKHKVAIIIRNYRHYLYNKFSKSSLETLMAKVRSKYKHKDFAISRMLSNINSTLSHLNNENLQLKGRINKKRNMPPSLLSPTVMNSYISSSDYSNLCYITTSSNTNNEKIQLEQKINEILLNYKELLITGEKYTQKIQKIVTILNSNEEIKKSLHKNGIIIK